MSDLRRVAHRFLDASFASMAAVASTIGFGQLAYMLDPDTMVPKMLPKLQRAAANRLRLASVRFPIKSKGRFGARARFLAMQARTKRR